MRISKYAGYLGEGDALKKLGHVDDAIQAYTKVINNEAK